MGKIKRSERGFGQYLVMTDTYGAEVKVTESSTMGPAHVWIFIRGGHANRDVSVEGTGAHLSMAQARRVMAALDQFLGDRGRRPSASTRGRAE